MIYRIYDNSLKYSGNNTTLNRLSKLLNLSKTSFNKNNLIGIHAFKFGKNVINRNINFILIIGGTDIYYDIFEKEKKEIILKTLKQAKYIITFNSYMYNKVIKFYPNIKINKLKIIKQSVTDLYISPFNLREKYNITSKKIFLVVGNLRDVKGIDFITDFFNTYSIKKDFCIVIIGKKLNNKYTFPKGIIHINGLERKFVHSCMKQADGLINSSINEGMSSTILEAMKLKCPVYVRKNEGNCSIVIDNYSGYIFETLFDLYYAISYDTKLITEFAYNYVSFFHDPNIEKVKYQKLLYY